MSSEILKGIPASFSTARIFPPKALDNVHHVTKVPKAVVRNPFPLAKLLKLGLGKDEIGASGEQKVGYPVSDHYRLFGPAL